MEIRQFKKINLLNENDLAIEVEWDVYIEDQYSHSYCQFYSKNNYSQFLEDLPDIASQYQEYFERF